MLVPAAAAAAAAGLSHKAERQSSQGSACTHNLAQGTPANTALPKQQVHAAPPYRARVLG